MNFSQRVGRCFELSLYKITEITKNCKVAFLVHGTITDNLFGTNNTIGHAWIETDKRVIDPVLDIDMDKTIYYALYGAKPERRYTKLQAAENALEFEHYGPWHSGCVNIIRTKANTPSGKRLGPGVYKD